MNLFTRNKTRLMVSAIFLGALILGNPSPANSADPTAYGGLIWSGISLSQVGGFSQSITPIKSYPTVQWDMFFGTKCSNSGNGVTSADSCFLIQLFPDGSAQFSDLLATSSETKTPANAKCTTKTTSILSAPFAGESDCWVHISFREGEKYTFSVRKTTSSPGSWWLATVQFGNSGTVIPIGEIRHDLLPATTLFENELFTTDNSGEVTYADCNLVPNVVTIFGQPANDIAGGTVTLLRDSSSCARHAITHLTDGSDAIQFDFGGIGISGVKPTPTLVVPPIMSAKNYSYKISGKVLSIIIAVPRSANRAFLVASILDYPTASPLEGTIKDGLANFSIKLSDKSFGLKTQVNIYSTNNYGDSPSVRLPIEIPKEKKTTPTVKATTPAKISKAPMAPKKTQAPQISCSKGSQVREFIGAACPPGWQRK